MKALVIVNPMAAHGKVGRNWKQSESRLHEKIGPFDTVFTERPGHAEVLVRQGLKDGYDHIHIYGGDGTATESISGFFQNGKALRPEVLFSVWPGGTGCDFHRAILLPDTFKNRGADGITVIDVGRLTFLDHQKKECEKYFLNIASCGISGYVDQLMAKKWKRLGSAGFLLNTIEGLARYKNRRVRIKTDRGDLGERVVRAVAIANGRFFGGGMKIAPDAQLDDGKFQMVILGDIGLADALINTPKIYSGEHMSHPKIETQNITWTELTSDEEVLLDLDGEPLGTLPLRVQIIPAALRLKTY
ncbi:MAG TPA: diacylglycerol kinase family protein [Oligoflexus sp.]|uniref:diacylglycerol/lipid kinase family protein n=1 Tax=Oligoflexus sp. TaxID=1971216 RepID=UPI002D7E7EF9|nr:diacylglycerol kinase family protein [Oligoflexus sp.]HET9239319.1 diacylglycerol kinase family protein [Oligoflexus sp.]